MGVGFGLRCSNKECNHKVEVNDDYTGLVWSRTYHCLQCRDFFEICVDEEGNVIDRSPGHEFEVIDYVTKERGAACPKCGTRSTDRVFFEEAYEERVPCPKCGTNMKIEDEWFFDD